MERLCDGTELKTRMDFDLDSGDSIGMDEGTNTEETTQDGPKQTSRAQRMDDDDTVSSMGAGE